MTLDRQTQLPRSIRISIDIERTRLGIALALGVPLSDVWNVSSGGERIR